MTDTLRLLVHELVGRFTDHAGQQHIGLWFLLAVQTEPVHMDANDGSSHRKISGSPMSADAAVLGWLSDVATGARSLEDSLRTVAHTCERPRGGSDANTVRSLQEIATLATTVRVMTPGSPWPARVEDQLASWVRQARHLLGVDQRPVRLPQVACPYVHDDGRPCGAYTLRQIPEDGRIVCLACRTVWTSADWLGTVVAS